MSSDVHNTYCVIPFPFFEYYSITNTNVMSVSVLTWRPEGGSSLNALELVKNFIHFAYIILMTSHSFACYFSNVLVVCKVQVHGLGPLTKAIFYPLEQRKR